MCYEVYYVSTPIHFSQFLHWGLAWPPEWKCINHMPKIWTCYWFGELDRLGRNAGFGGAFSKIFRDQALGRTTSSEALQFPLLKVEPFATLRASRIPKEVSGWHEEGWLLGLCPGRLSGRCCHLGSKQWWGRWPRKHDLPIPKNRMEGLWHV